MLIDCQAEELKSTNEVHLIVLYKNLTQHTNKYT